MPLKLAHGSAYATLNSNSIWGFTYTNLQDMVLVLGNYRRFHGQEIAVTNYISEKTFDFGDVSVDLESREICIP